MGFPVFQDGDHGTPNCDAVAVSLIIPASTSGASGGLAGVDQALFLLFVGHQENKKPNRLGLGDLV